MPTDVLTLSGLARNAIKGGHREAFAAAATPEVVEEVCNELLVARMITAAAVACADAKDHESKRKAWRKLLYMISAHHSRVERPE